MLSGELLDIVHENVNEDLKNTIINSNNEKAVTLLLDGWSNSKNSPLIASSICIGNSPYLLSADECGSEKKTAEYTVEVAKKNMSLCNEKYEVKVFAIGTDNEAKMVRFRELMNEEFPEIITYGCSAHYLNLVEQAVSPISIIGNVKKVHVYFRNHHRPSGWLKEKNGLRPQIPNDTRWNSQLDCLNTYVQNWKLYLDIVRERRSEIESSVKKIIEDRSVYNSACDLFKQLQIIGGALDILQSDNTTFSTAYDIWKSLLMNEEISIYRTEIQKRFKQAMQPFHGLAYITNPQFLLEGKSLSAEEDENVFQWVRAKHPNFSSGIMSFTIKDPDIYPPSMFSPEIANKMSTHKWWCAMKKKWKTAMQVQI